MAGKNLEENLFFRFSFSLAAFLLLPEMALASAAHLEEEVKLLRKIQDEVQKTINTRAQLVAQLKENELVKQELDLLDDESRIFKLIGPILVKQEKKEADSNVSKRIDFLQV